MCRAADEVLLVETSCNLETGAAEGGAGGCKLFYIVGPSLGIPGHDSALCARRCIALNVFLCIGSECGNPARMMPCLPY